MSYLFFQITKHQQFTEILIFFKQLPIKVWLCCFFTLSDHVHLWAKVNFCYMFWKIIWLLMAPVNCCMFYFSHAVLACSWNPAGTSIISCEKGRKVVLWSDYWCQTSGRSLRWLYLTCSLPGGIRYTFYVASQVDPFSRFTLCVTSQVGGWIACHQFIWSQRTEEVPDIIQCLVFK